MSDFAEWVQESAGAESKRISTKLYGGMMPEGETMLRDLANLAAVQHEALEGVMDQLELADEAILALRAAEDFKEKYE